jgi:hypothetical protein
MANWAMNYNEQEHGDAGKHITDVGQIRPVPGIALQ